MDKLQEKLQCAMALIVQYKSLELYWRDEHLSIKRYNLALGHCHTISIEMFPHLIKVMSQNDLVLIGSDTLL